MTIFYTTNMADLVGSDSDEDPPPMLIDDEEIYPLRVYGTQTVIALQVKRSSFETYVGQRQWVLVELELVISHLEWGPTLEQLSNVEGIRWVASAAQELPISRQLI